MLVLLLASQDESSLREDVYKNQRQRSMNHRHHLNFLASGEG